MAYNSSLFAAGIEEIRKSWGWFLVSGIVLMVLGAVCIVKAQTATTFSILALGWVLTISGVMWLVNSLQAWTWGGFFVYLLNALIRGVTGYLLIRHPDAGAAGVTMVLAVLFIVGGLFRVGGASAIQFPRWGWTVFAGVVSTVLGISLLIAWPTASSYFIGIAVGTDLIFDGAALLGFAGAIHSLPAAQTRIA
ncbi:uncharacterized membrane protein HdeD (DUF308 family) [Edaphobacter aggregans]|jgi:uncharacterized membrane protein HdeD (DUF308 family)|uniref:Uncharacterized membrane protein HdeD (DUF308 family) n=1 Tax=Edaphobacter aggregans TaxID=570835 RepID=A0A3R9QD37_9BACT|nr:DUF308 domain-containing protein [Edaphobacter aggregans]RSL18422.1 uncharacterized membrane protein HdeD (DUF308 family) [Edaphobacter aggregans]